MALLVEHGEVPPCVESPGPQQTKGLLSLVGRDAEGEWEGVRRVAKALLEYDWVSFGGVESETPPPKRG